MRIFRSWEYLFRLVAISVPVLPQLTSAQYSVQNPPPYPAAWATYLRMEQDFNVAGYRPMTADEKRPIPVYEFLIPIEKAKTLKSQLTQESIDKLARIKKDGREWIKVLYIPHAKGVKIDDLIPSWGTPTQNYWATKIPSHSTYFMWDPQMPESDPFFIKTLKVSLSLVREPEVQNGFGNAKAAVAINDFVHASLSQEPDSELDYFPEPLAVEVSINQTNLDPQLTTYAFSLRSVIQAGGPVSGENILLPLHGLLGLIFYSPRAAEDPFLKALDRAWYQTTLLPKIATALARLNYKYGIYPEAHAQNLLIVVNPHTGIIERIAFRDLNDVMVDLYTRFIQGKPLNASTIAGAGISEINRYHVAGSSLDNPLERSGSNVAEFAINPLITDLSGYLNALNLFKIFNSNYLSEVEKITGRRIQKSWPLINQFDANAQSAVPVWLGTWETSKILQTTYDEVNHARSVTIDPSLKKYDQNLLANLFAEGATHFRAFYPFVDSVSQVSRLTSKRKARYAFDRQTIMLLNQDDKPIAYAYGFTPSEVTQIESTRFESSSLLPPWLRGCAKKFL